MTSMTLKNVVAEGYLNELHSNANFDTVKPLNGKPSVDAEGFKAKKTSDSVQAKSVDGELNNPILTDTPNLYKQTGVSMSNIAKIPFTFTAIPEYFYTSGWLPLDNPEKFTKMMIFLHWSFGKCTAYPKRVPFDGKMIDLGPFEFIHGRTKSAAECGLTEGQLRNQLKIHLSAKFIEKAPTSTTSRFTVYRWVTDNFYENNNQLSNQLSNQLNDHKSDERSKKIDKEDHPSIPSSEKKRKRNGLNDDFSSKEDKKGKIHIFTGKYRNEMAFEVWLTQEELDACMKFHGNREKIIWQIEQIAASPKRKVEISDWSNAIIKWKFPNAVVDKSEKNEAYGRNLEEQYNNPSNFWGMEYWKDPKKDQKGTVFYSKNGQNGETLFIPFVDPDYENKIHSAISKYKLKKKGEK